MPTVKAQIEDLFHKLQVLQNQIGGGGGGGETNTASNLGVGLGVYDQKVGVDLQFRSLVADSLMIDIALGGAGNHEVHFDVDPSEIDLGDLGDVNVGGLANNEVLTWDSVASEWQNKSIGALGASENWWAHRKSERYYTHWDQYGMTTYTLLIDYIYAIPFIVPVQQNFDRIALYIYSAVNRVARLGIYEDDGDVFPGTLVHGTAEFDCSTTGCKEETIDETLDPGLYWLAVLNGVASGNVRALYQQYGAISVLGRTACATPLTANISYYGSQAYGAMPDPYPAGANSEHSNIPAIMLRKS